jgi:cell surface protein SprA
LHKKILKFQVCSFFTIASCIGILLYSTDCYSQGRDRSKFQTIIDTSQAGLETGENVDTSISRQPVDSTARVKNFKYARIDIPNPSFGTYQSPFFLKGSQYVERRITFDSLDNAVITETFEGQPIKYPLKIPLDRYLQISSDLELRDRFYQIAADFYKIETNDELEKLFKNITDITIPLPFTSETIFGPPTINLKINGAIDITASYQRNYSDQQTITDISQTQNNINFKQEVQVTTKGSVGDKLTIDADWNSQRTFDYENQLKLK